MKTFFKLIVLFAVVSGCNRVNNPEDTARKDTSNASEDNVVGIYYFHVTHRCPSCLAIEAAIKKTLDTYFKEKVNSGVIKFYVLNTDDEKNKSICEKFEAYGSSLYITGVKDGKEATVDLTSEGFKYARSKEDKFIGILKAEIDKALK
jgi:hypothetical protein